MITTIHNSLYNKEVTDTVLRYRGWDRLVDKSILITGATGLIGSYLTDVLLKANSEGSTSVKIYAMGRNEGKLKERFGNGDEMLVFMEQDVTQSFRLSEIEPDYIIHAASMTHPVEYALKPIETITANITGMLSLLESVKDAGKGRLLTLSSVEIYGENCGGLGSFRESDCGYIDCNTLRAGYPESKRLSEALAQAYREEWNCDFVTARLCRIYGPTMNMDDSKALSQFISCAVKKEDIILKSEGNQYYSYLYVADAVTALLDILLYGETGQAYNVADSNSDITLREAAIYLAELAGKKVIYELPRDEEKKGYSRATQAILNADKLGRIGWKPKYSIYEGLERTIGILKYSGECNG